MIGVFDSGFGGLTVHRALIEALPERDFRYLGDNKNAPYGLRPPIEVLNLTCNALDLLFGEGCTLVILACNTASTVALRWVQQHWLPARRQADGVARNVLGVVVPAIEAVTGVGWNEPGPHSSPATPSGTVAIFATRRTVESECYPTEIRRRRPDMNVVQQACSELAGSIERGASRDELRAIVDRHVAELMGKLRKDPDFVILACTHYPLVTDLFAAALPPGVRLIQQPDSTARALAGYLRRHPEYDRSTSGRRTFLSTGFSVEALPLIEKFWGGPVPFTQA